jgi:hypothetical protein
MQDNALELGNFLVFSYSRILEFDVTIYRKDCCEKNAVVANKKKRKLFSYKGNQDKVDQHEIKA